MRLPKMAVAIDNQHHGFKPFNRSQRCKLQSFGHLDHSYTLQKLTQTSFSSSSHSSFEQAFEYLASDNIHRSFSTPCLSGEDDLNSSSSNPRIGIVSGKGSPVHALVVEVAIAMASGINPKPLPSGLGGAYVFVNQNGTNIAVAKPVDEEPLDTSNPKCQMLGQPSSIRVGATGFRELAAYLLDHGGFSGVPPTALVKFFHASSFFVTTDDEEEEEAAVKTVPNMPKLASLQRFIGHGFDAGELGPSFYSVSSVHQIGILDIRLLNLDRHAGNMLVMKHDHNSSYDVVAGVADLVPIDHGFCLPEWLDDPYFEWLHWPQASVPFSESELEYISKLNPFKDADILSSEVPSLRVSSKRVLVVCTIFLKQAAAAGLCLAGIGQMMTRKFCGGEETPSELETICSQVKGTIIPLVSNNENSKDEAEEECNNCEKSGISFGDLNRDQWELFLENFSELLSGVFEDKKCRNN